MARWREGRFASLCSRAQTHLGLVVLKGELLRLPPVVAPRECLLDRALRPHPHRAQHLVVVGHAQVVRLRDHLPRPTVGEEHVVDERVPLEDGAVRLQREVGEAQPLEVVRKQHLVQIARAQPVRRLLQGGIKALGTAARVAVAALAQLTLAHLRGYNAHMLSFHAHTAQRPATRPRETPDPAIQPGRSAQLGRRRTGSGIGGGRRSSKSS